MEGKRRVGKQGQEGGRCAQPHFSHFPVNILLSKLVNQKPVDQEL